MGLEEPKLLITHHDLWPTHQRVTSHENDDLMRSFNVEELDFFLKDTKADTAPGPRRVASHVLQEILAYVETGSPSDPEWVCSWDGGYCQTELRHPLVDSQSQALTISSNSGQLR
jgi:hypothetical protein